MDSKPIEYFELQDFLLKLDNHCLGNRDYSEAGQRGFVIVRLEDIPEELSQINDNYVQNYYSIKYVQAGQASVVNHNVPLSSGSIYITKPGQINAIKYDNNVKGFLVCFDKGFFLNLDHSKNLFITFPFLTSLSKTILKVPQAEREYFVDLLTRIHREFMEFRPISAEFIRLWSIELLFQIKACINSAELKINESPNQMSELAQKFLEALEDHFINGMKEQFVAPISVHDIADQLCVHPGYLSECVKDSLGKTAKSVIMERFLLAAQSRLKNTEMPVSGISYLFGFDNPSYFSRFFKKQVGITPQEYRKQNLDNL